MSDDILANEEAGSNGFPTGALVAGAALLAGALISRSKKKRLHVNEASADDTGMWGGMFSMIDAVDRKEQALRSKLQELQERHRHVSSAPENRRSQMNNWAAMNNAQRIAYLEARREADRLRSAEQQRLQQRNPVVLNDLRQINQQWGQVSSTMPPIITLSAIAKNL